MHNTNFNHCHCFCLSRMATLWRDLNCRLYYVSIKFSYPILSKDNWCKYFRNKIKCVFFKFFLKITTIFRKTYKTRESVTYLMWQNAWFHIGGSRLDRTDDFLKFCRSGPDRIQFLQIRIGLGLKNLPVRSSLQHTSKKQTPNFILWDFWPIIACQLFGFSD